MTQDPYYKGDLGPGSDRSTLTQMSTDLTLFVRLRSAVRTLIDTERHTETHIYVYIVTWFGWETQGEREREREREREKNRDKLMGVCAPPPALFRMMERHRACILMTVLTYVSVKI